MNRYHPSQWSHPSPLSSLKSLHPKCYSLLSSTKPKCQYDLSLSFDYFAAVVILCTVLTISTAFEYKLEQKPCKLEEACLVNGRTVIWSTANRTKPADTEVALSDGGSESIRLLPPSITVNATLNGNELGSNETMNIQTISNDSCGMGNQTNWICGLKVCRMCMGV